MGREGGGPDFGVSPGLRGEQRTHLWGAPPPAAHLGAEGEVVAQRGDVVLQQVDQALVEVVVLALHVRVAAWKWGGEAGVSTPFLGGAGGIFGVPTSLRGSFDTFLGSAPKIVGFWAPQLGSPRYSWVLCPTVGFSTL